jgi:L-threonylcarbamoyladenylate synthase
MHGVLGLMPPLLPIDPVDPDPKVLIRAASVLRQGGVVAYPTETLYGLGVDPFREEALDRLYALKGRPESMPVSILVKDVAMLEEVSHDLTPQAMRLIDAFLPGPLTLVLRARPRLPTRLTSGTGKIGIRISAHPLMRHLFAEYPSPITTTSANPTGKPDARDAAGILAYFPEGIDCILDAGPVTVRLGSTVVDVTSEEPMILREGAITADRIAVALK